MFGFLGSLFGGVQGPITTAEMEQAANDPHPEPLPDEDAPLHPGYTTDEDLVEDEAWE